MTDWPLLLSAGELASRNTVKKDTTLLLGTTLPQETTPGDKKKQNKQKGQGYHRGTLDTTPPPGPIRLPIYIYILNHPGSTQK